MIVKILLYYYWLSYSSCTSMKNMPSSSGELTNNQTSRLERGPTIHSTAYDATASCHETGTDKGEEKSTSYSELGHTNPVMPEHNSFQQDEASPVHEPSTSMNPIYDDLADGTSNQFFKCLVDIYYKNSQIKTAVSGMDDLYYGDVGLVNDVNVKKFNFGDAIKYIYDLYRSYESSYDQKYEYAYVFIQMHKLLENFFSNILILIKQTQENLSISDCSEQQQMETVKLSIYRYKLDDILACTKKILDLLIKTHVETMQTCNGKYEWSVEPSGNLYEAYNIVMNYEKLRSWQLKDGDMWASDDGQTIEWNEPIKIELSKRVAKKAEWECWVLNTFYGNGRKTKDTNHFSKTDISQNDGIELANASPAATEGNESDGGNTKFRAGLKINKEQNYGGDHSGKYEVDEPSQKLSQENSDRLVSEIKIQGKIIYWQYVVINTKFAFIKVPKQIIELKEKIKELPEDKAVFYENEFKDISALLSVNTEISKQTVREEYKKLKEIKKSIMSMQKGNNCAIQMKEYAKLFKAQANTIIGILNHLYNIYEKINQRFEKTSAEIKHKVTLIEGKGATPHGQIYKEREHGHDSDASRDHDSDASRDHDSDASRDHDSDEKEIQANSFSTNKPERNSSFENTNDKPVEDKNYFRECAAVAIVVIVVCVVTAAFLKAE
ncbi:hypothetical protein ENBRE01_2891 [Enteropsectra breve]|nr:hypothetical protein ENBRE01_2891 [Enteropsectra breve]